MLLVKRHSKKISKKHFGLLGYVKASDTDFAQERKEVGQWMLVQCRL